MIYLLFNVFNVSAAPWESPNLINALWRTSALGGFSYRIFFAEVGLHIGLLCFQARVCKQPTPLWQQLIFIYEIAQVFWLFSDKLSFCVDEDFSYWLDQPHFLYYLNLYKISTGVLSDATAASTERQK